MNIAMRQVRDHQIEVLIQEGEDLPGILPSFGLELQLLEGLQGIPGFLCVPAIADEVPDAFQKGPQLPHLWVGFHDLDQRLLLLRAHALVGLEQPRALLPERLGQGLPLVSVPCRADPLAARFDLLAVSPDVAPQLLPDVLDDGEVVILDTGLRVNRLDRMSQGLAVIDRAGLESGVPAASTASGKA